MSAFYLSADNPDHSAAGTVLWRYETRLRLFLYKTSARSSDVPNVPIPGLSRSTRNRLCD